jgi:hypothetical protein
MPAGNGVEALMSDLPLEAWEGTPVSADMLQRGYENAYWRGASEMSEGQLTEWERLANAANGLYVHVLPRDLLALIAEVRRLRCVLVEAEQREQALKTENKQDGEDPWAKVPIEAHDLHGTHERDLP